MFFREFEQLVLIIVAASALVLVLNGTRKHKSRLAVSTTRVFLRRAAADETAVGADFG